MDMGKPSLTSARCPARFRLVWLLAPVCLTTLSASANHGVATNVINRSLPQDSLTLDEMRLRPARRGVSIMYYLRRAN